MSAQQKANLHTLREEIDQLIDSGEATKASMLLDQLWRQNPSPALAGFVVSCFERLRPKLAPVSCRIAILRSFTVEPIIPLLRAGAIANGFDLIVQVGDLNAYAQEVLDPTGNLYHFSLDIVILAVQTRDVAPELWGSLLIFRPVTSQRSSNGSPVIFGNGCRHFAHTARLTWCCTHWRVLSYPAMAYWMLNLRTAKSMPFGVLSRTIRPGARARWHLCSYYEALIARHGRALWHDERKWLTMRMPIKANCLVHLANEWLRFLHPLTGKVRKALVTDLDNTLWGGVIGEDGMNGIRVCEEYPGAAYQALQRAMLDLYQRGIILAVCSKNNLSDAMEVFEHHPGMLLRPQHFAVLRINWNDKAQNLREIAAELNIGIDALAFWTTIRWSGNGFAANYLKSPLLTSLMTQWAMPRHCVIIRSLSV